MDTNDEIKIKNLGINPININSLKRNIVTYTSRLNSCFNDMDSIVDKLEDGFVGSSFKNFNLKYLQIKRNNPNVIKNVDLHIDELNSVISKFEGQDEHAAVTINKNINKQNEGAIRRELV